MAKKKETLNAKEISKLMDKLQPKLNKLDGTICELQYSVVDLLEGTSIDLEKLVKSDKLKKLLKAKVEFEALEDEYDSLWDRHSDLIE